MTDARAGLTAADLPIAQHLRSREKPLSWLRTKLTVLMPILPAPSLVFRSVKFTGGGLKGRGVTNMIEYALTPYAEAMGIVRQDEGEVTEEREYTEEAEASKKRCKIYPSSWRSSQP